MPSTDSLLDLVGVAQRSSTFEFHVLDKTLNKIGTVSPDTGQLMTIGNDTTRSIKRSLSGCVMDPGTWEHLNLLTDRIAPYMVLSNGEKLPLGVFLFGDAARSRATYGRTLQASLVDQGLMLDQGTDHTVAVAPQSSIVDAIDVLLADSPLIAFDVDDTSQITGDAWLVWPVGTSLLKILTDLAALGGYYSPYFDNAGVLRVKVVPDLASAVPTVRYRSGQNIFTDTIVESDDALTAPNRYVVVDTSATDNPVFGTWDIPDDAPHSFVNRGFRVTDVVSMQGVGTNDNAAASAKALGQQDRSALQHVEFAGPPDPRHDTYDVLDYRIGDPAMDGKYREIAWSLPLVEGANMTHSLRRIYGVLG